MRNKLIITTLLGIGVLFIAVPALANNDASTSTDSIPSPPDLTQSESNSTISLPQDCDPPYGNWDEPTLTCTLTQDLTEGLEIIESNITLDCNGHKIKGADTEHCSIQY